MSLPCTVCLVRDFASDEAKDALIAYQARQLDRLSHLAHGIPYVGPDPEDLVWDDEEDEPEPPEPAPDATFVMESLLGHEDIFRRPGRVAAPRLLERLAEHGFAIVHVDALSHPPARMSEPGTASTAPALDDPA